MVARREPILGLDVIRLAAALLVVVYHLAFKQFAHDDTFVTQLTGTGTLPPWWRASWWGWIGVQIFFVISGAVIAYSMTNVSPGVFLAKRVERLYPALLVCGTLALPAQIFLLGTHAGEAATLYLRMILFLPAGPWLFGQFWTLPIEAVFYGLMWLLLLAGRADALPKAAWGLAIASAAFWIVDGVGGPLPNGRLSGLLLLQHGCYFAIGMRLARPTTGRWPDRLLIPVCVATAAVQIHAAASGEHPGYGLDGLWMAPFLVWLAAVVAIAASIRYHRVIYRSLAGQATILGTIGRTTYPLYLIHMHAGLPVLLFTLRCGVPPPVAILFAVFAGGVAAIGVVLVEPWMRRHVATVVRLAIRAPAVAQRR